SVYEFRDYTQATARQARFGRTVTVRGHSQEAVDAVGILIGPDDLAPRIDRMDFGPVRAGHVERRVDPMAKGRPLGSDQREHGLIPSLSLTPISPRYQRPQFMQAILFTSYCQ